jgi:chemotaxis signal transduction protein
MPIFSPLRNRKQGTAQTTKQIIVFMLQTEWFALPIESVKQVLPLGEVYGDPQQTGVSLTLYQNQDLLVIDVGKRIFPHGNQSISNKQNDQIKNDRFLVVVQNQKGEIIGLPIDSPPSLKRPPDSAFSLLPAAYMSAGNIQCVSKLMVDISSDRPYFLLNPELLFTPENITIL